MYRWVGGWVKRCVGEWQVGRQTNGCVGKLVGKWVSGRMVIQMDGRKKNANAGSVILQTKSGRGARSEEKPGQDVAWFISANDSGQFVWAEGCSSEWLQLTVRHSLKKLLIFCYVSNSSCVGRHSSVGTATRYGMDGPGIESRWGRNFPHPSKPALGPIQLTIELVPGLSRG